MPLKRFFALGLLGFFTMGLMACVSSTPYGPASRNGLGYSDQRIESDRYRVSFRGNAQTRRETVEDFLLLRSAELTVQNGYDYFIVVENDTEARSFFTTLNSAGGFHGGGFGSFYGRRGFGAFPYYPYGFGPGFGNGFGGGFATTTTESTAYQAIAFIRLYKGTKPDNEPAAFNAREVMDNLRPSISN